MNGMKPFHFNGDIPASKSILNRLLIIQSHFPELRITGDSKADDVMKMKNALAQLDRGEPADCGAAGTTLRFVALRASRIPGTHHLSGTLRLFERPHEEIARVLKQLGCELEFGRQRMTIRGNGWTQPEGDLVVDRSLSSQFASAVLLNAWNLPFDLRMQMSGEHLSESYFRMTTEILGSLGMALKIDESTAVVTKNSVLKRTEWKAESDLSSAFAVASVAIASGGSAEFSEWPDASLQPDAVFVSILRQMGCSVETGGGRLRLSAPANGLSAVDCNLRECPDLFPVLSVLCAVADGRSKLHGAPQLVHKESNRLKKTSELIALMGRKFKVLSDGLEIEGMNQRPLTTSEVSYDTDHDHRLAMAGAVARAAGFPIRLSETKVVTKSFPEFWDIVDRLPEVR
ncbi:MAG TPA: hypothetical protein VM432_10825 [Bdellovibrionales bacterium]|nr:hypothetical protein [Bdellovibrionales bacterium]